MGISRELQIGKAGEHLVCADLILQGHNAFLSDQGLNYDIVVDFQGNLLRGQVKATLNLKLLRKRTGDNQLYRFGSSCGRGNKRTFASTEVEFFAFAFLDQKKVAYLPTSALISPKTNRVIRTIEFKTRLLDRKGRKYPNGTVRQVNWGRFLEDFQCFSVVLKEIKK